MRIAALAGILTLATVLAMVGVASGDNLALDGFEKACRFVEDDYEDGLYDCRGSTPSIQRPSMVPSEQASWLAEGDVVIGVVANGTAKAYPLSILDWHQIVNDEIGGTPIGVTYSPLTGSALVVEREASTRTLTLHVSGFLHHNALVMIDAQTNSLWPQIEAEAARGQLHGQELSHFASATTSWSDWRQRHPETLVLERPGCEDNSTENRGDCTGGFQRDYQTYPYGDYRLNDEIGTGGERRGPIAGFHPKTTVVGLRLDGQTEASTASKAYPLAVLSEQQLIHDSLGATPIVVAWTGSDASAFVRAEDERFSLASDASVLVDEDDRRYDALSGHALDGGEDRQPVDTVDLFWFAWVDHYPNTHLFTGERTVTLTHEATKPTPAPSPLATLASVCAALLAVGRVRGLRPR